jgi:23S rRNA (cytosine1962-C5)-methyltransferase
VESERGRPLGWALWSSASQIALRLIDTTGGSAPMDDERAWWRARLEASIASRDDMGIDATAWRLVHGESDRLPALIVDRYGDEHGTWIVVQALCQGMDRRLPMLTELLVELLAPRGILARNDPRVRRLEGLAEETVVLFGEVPDAIEISEGELRFGVDLRHGQKTGSFLDQRENHAAAAQYARGRALDAFTYHGGFALPMAKRADAVLAIDSSDQAVAATRANAVRNHLANVEVREANVFDELRELEIAGDRFDTIVLDPPAFAKNKASVERAAAGYKEINLRAMKLLAPGGHLLTCSCSYNVDADLFRAIVEAAALDARAPMALVETRLQSRDHPILLGVPETNYLKCLVLRRLS